MNLILKATLVFILWLDSTQAKIISAESLDIRNLDSCGTDKTATCGLGDGCVSNILRAAGVKVTSPDGINDVFNPIRVIDGKQNTYWYQTEGSTGPHILEFTLPTNAGAFDGYSFRPLSTWSPKTWNLTCDGDDIDSVIDESFDSGTEFKKCFGEAFQCATVQLIITAWTSGAPAIREVRLIADSTTAPPTSPPTTSSPSNPPTSPPTSSSPSTSAPTIDFQAFDNQDFNIAQPSLQFFDINGQFSLEINYTVGLTAHDLNITLMNENCTAINNSISDTIQIGSQSVKNHEFSKQILLFKKSFSTSPLVSEKNQATGASSGTLRFCVHVETLTEDGVSVTFRKTNVQVTYDLTTNNFKVEGNNINENTINTSTKEVTSKYGISACRCTAENFDCDTTKPLPFLKQNGYVFICIKPDTNSSSVQISNFFMRFEQDNVSKYTAVTLGNDAPISDNLSTIQKEDGTFKIVSRLVTVLFEKTSFDVKGNAYLVFKGARRSLVSAPVQGLRSAKETTQGDSAGDVEFSMDVTLNKATGNVTSKSANNAGIAVVTVGGITIVAILFVMFKKMNN